MVIEDFTMLGKTVPETRADGRVTVCCAGYSEEMRMLIRIYPLAIYDAPKMWSVNRVAVERNPQDSRAESWKLKGSRDNHEKINGRVFSKVGEIPASERAALCERLVSASIAGANETLMLGRSRQSLAVIRPIAPPRLTYTENPDADDHPQMRLFDEEPAKSTAGAARFPMQPRLTFNDEAGTHHLQLREWGVYEYMRKHGAATPTDPVGHLRKRLKNSPLLLCGNMNNRRNCWLVISVLPASRQSCLFVDTAEAA